MARLVRSMLLLPLLLPLGGMADGRDLPGQDPEMIETENMVEGTLLALGQLDQPADDRDLAEGALEQG